MRLTCCICVCILLVAGGCFPSRMEKTMLPSQFAPETQFASEQITGVLGDADTWKSITTHFRTRTDGQFPVAAEAEISFDVTTGNFISDLFYKIPEAPHYKRGSFRLDQHRNKLSDYNRISLLIYPDLPDRASIWVEAIGAPSWTAATFPLRPRQWNKVWLDLGHLEPEGRAKIRELMIGNTALGQLPGDQQWQSYYLKDLRFEKVPPRNIQGWETSAAYVSLSQIGYAPWDKEKIAVFSCENPAETFQVCDAKSGRILLEGKLTILDKPYGKFKIADFSAVSRTGLCYLQAGLVRSPVFPITPAPFAPALDNYLHWLHCMRSGCETPAHPDCFQDDGLREDTKEAVDLVGGWFDASDLRLYNSMSMSNILRPLAASEAFLKDDALAGKLCSEIRWGTDFLQKIWDSETDLPFTMLCVHMPREEKYKKLKKHYYKNNNYWSDNRKGTADDRIIHTPWKSVYLDGSLDNYLHHLGICAAGAEALNIETAIGTPAGRQQILERTERHFARMRDAKQTAENRRFVAGVNPDSTPALAMSLEIAVNLGRCTGNSDYWRQAAELAEKLLQRQQLDLLETNEAGMVSGFFDRIPLLPGLSRPATPVAALLFYLQHAPESSENLKTRIHGALRIYADLFIRKAYRMYAPYTLPVQLGTTSGSGKMLLGKWVKTQQEIFVSPTFSPGTIGHESVALTMLAGFLQDAELYAYARAMLLPHLGFNPSSWSYVAETGQDYKPDMMSTTLGHMRGMTSIGVGMRQGVPFYPQHASSNEIYTQLTPYFQGMALQHASCRLRGKLLCGQQPAGLQKIVFRHPDLPEEIAVRSDRQGNYGPVELSAGLRYEIVVGNRGVDQVAVFSGGSASHDVDLDGAVLIQGIQVPEQVRRGLSFKATVELFNYAAVQRSIRLQVQGLRVDPVATEVPLDLAPGKQLVNLMFRVPEKAADAPYAVLLNCNGQSDNFGKSACGVILSTSKLPAGELLEINGSFADPVQSGEDLLPAGWKKIMGPARIRTVVKDDVSEVEISSEKTVQLHSRLFAIKPGMIVKLKFEVLGGGGTGLPIAGIHVYDSAGRWLSAPASKSFEATRNNWRSYELIGEIPANIKGKTAAQSSVCIGINGSATALFRKVSVEVIRP